VKEELLFEKRSKNFCSLRYAVRQRQHSMGKSFLVLFCKKELLSCATVLPVVIFTRP
jgi:hypothetical protein